MFQPKRKRVGNEDFVNWLTHLLDPQIHFEFSEATRDGLRVVLLRIDPAHVAPVRFKGVEHIRVGSHKKRLKDHRDHERRLWQVLNAVNFESMAAKDGLRVEDVTTMLDYPAFFSLTQAPLPENRSQIVEALRQAEMVSYDVETEWSITNLGALLLAKDLREFPALSRKAPRVVRYDGRGRASTIRRQDGQRGYAAGFDGLIDYLMALLPQREIIEGALRTTVGYPVLAVRELVANALIHQDLSITGMGTMVEVFDDRIEITNPGKPLIPVDRFIDLPPRSRNEKLSGAMRRLRICEEQGSGWDKVTAAIELHQLPPPLVETQENATRVVVFGPRPLARMEKADRIRAVYQHACLRYVMHENMTNTTVRQRFGLDDKARPTASRLIREAVNARAVVAYDPTVGNKSLRYVPWWASPGREAVS